MIKKTLIDGLNLGVADNLFTIFRDHTTELEYIRKNIGLLDEGLFIELEPYDYHVFMDFREVQDNEKQHYASLTSYLNGRGVSNIYDALNEVFLQPIHSSFSELINP